MLTKFLERSPAARALAKDLRDAQFPPVRLFEIFDSSATKIFEIKREQVCWQRSGLVAVPPVPLEFWHWCHCPQW